MNCTPRKKGNPIGYTHYWRRNKDISPETWAKIKDDVSYILNHQMNRGLSDIGDPDECMITDDVIRFNGRGDDGHETFLVTRLCPVPASYSSDKTQSFDFCKTNQKPYDVLVTAALLKILEHTGGEGFHVNSDGQFADWEPALGLLIAVCRPATPKAVEILKDQIGRE